MSRFTVYNYLNRPESRVTSARGRIDRVTCTETVVAPAAVAASISGPPRTLTAPISPVTELPNGPITGSSPALAHGIERGEHVDPGVPSTKGSMVNSAVTSMAAQRRSTDQPWASSSGTRGSSADQGNVIQRSVTRHTYCGSMIERGFL